MYMNRPLNIRKGDPERIELTVEEFAEAVRSGDRPRKGFDWAGWTRIFIAALIPVLIFITLFNETRFQVKQNTKAAELNRAWINDHQKTTEAIRSEIANMERKQAVILEKVDAIQKTLDKN